MGAMNRQEHWEAVYHQKTQQQLSWHQDEPATSLRLIGEIAPRHDRSIIDIGGGSSVLAGRLIDLGFSDVAVLDISQAAIDRAKERIGPRADDVKWIQADVTRIDDVGIWDIWHDRVTFHFLTDVNDRRAYVRLAERSVRPGGHLVMATFGQRGPEKCSGLPVQRYDGPSLSDEFAKGFRLVREFNETHRTPWSANQEFQWAVFQRA